MVSSRFPESLSGQSPDQHVCCSRLDASPSCSRARRSYVALTPRSRFSTPLAEVTVGGSAVARPVREDREQARMRSGEILEAEGIEIRLQSGRIRFEPRGAEIVVGVNPHVRRAEVWGLHAPSSSFLARLNDLGSRPRALRLTREAIRRRRSPRRRAPPYIGRSAIGRAGALSTDFVRTSRPPRRTCSTAARVSQRPHSVQRRRSTSYSGLLGPRVGLTEAEAAGQRPAPSRRAAVRRPLCRPRARRERRNERVRRGPPRDRTAPRRRNSRRRPRRSRAWLDRGDGWRRDGARRCARSWRIDLMVAESCARSSRRTLALN